ncbi:unannotated protein [freshwater metagenome]|uniref:Unannotated protein n=1 Tax=freshwater metagenome TaxID=449393 RepID=A0A6J6IAR3_9ZZZZ
MSTLPSNIAGIAAARTPQRGPIREAQKELTRRRLMDAGLEIFTEKGFDAATVEEITERANAGRTTFYTHFTSKSDIAIAIAVAETVELNASVSALGRTDPFDPASLHQWLLALETQFREDAMLVTLVMLHTEVAQEFLHVQEATARNALDGWLAAGFTPKITDPLEQIRLLLLLVNRWMYLYVTQSLPIPTGSREGLLLFVQTHLTAVFARPA